MKRRRLTFFLKICILITCVFSITNSFAVPNPEGIQVYQPNLHLSEEHKQKIAADIYRYQNADDVWDKLRREFMLPHYEDNPAVQEQIEWFMNHQDFLLSSATRAAPYLYYIMQQVHKRHLPAELVLLPMIESAYNPFAYSNVGAAGIWQMMPNTASGFGVKQNWWYDGRRDVIASTRAALDYLAYLGNFFEGNWLLAIAAYDTGEGNVLSAIRRNVRDGQPTDFWSLPVAQETRTYIPRLLALAVIMSRPEEFPIPWPAVHNAPYLAQVNVGAQIDLKNAAELAGLSLKKLMQLNPGYNHAATDANGKLFLPIEHVQQFTENLSHTSYPQPNVISYKIKKGDTLASIAKHFRISPNEIRNSNPLLARNFKPGKTLSIPNSISSNLLASANDTFVSSMDDKNPVEHKIKSPDASISALANALEEIQGKYTLQPGDTLYMVRNGDDLEKVAKRFHITTKTLIAVNQLSSNMLQPGSKLIVPTHLTKASETQTFQLTSGDTIYMVKQGDNIEAIAQKFHTTPTAIRVANLLTNNNLQQGDKLIIPTQQG
jgi:membrane-bound lytic murein transglycosylase D